VGQVEVFDPAGVVVGAKVGAPGADPGELFAEDPGGEFLPVVFRVDAGSEEKEGVEPGGVVAEAALAEKLQVVFGEIALHQQGVAPGGGRQIGREGAAALEIPVGQFFVWP